MKLRQYLNEEVEDKYVFKRLFKGKACTVQLDGRTFKSNPTFKAKQIHFSEIISGKEVSIKVHVLYKLLIKKEKLETKEKKENNNC